MPKSGMNFKVNLDPSLKERFSDAQLKEARKRAVEAAGMVWADETKEVTREDDHIDTSLYINSIGYVTNFAADPNSEKGSKQATESDVIHELIEEEDRTTLQIGSAVSYAEFLEKRYNLMARGLDRAEPRMKLVADAQIKRTLGL
ncbi:hypothetical protein [Planococcus sp. YIM B11945]|uniref:hypothetical protein n=1 Tax=Planococcus sp. YIM B11945 TaxID=3435410 RepID=UPI003D7E4253